VTPLRRLPLRTARRLSWRPGFFYVVVCIVPFLLLVIIGSAFLISKMVLREVLERLGTLLPSTTPRWRPPSGGDCCAGLTSPVGT
jgi:hypothetical protein